MKWISSLTATYCGLHEVRLVMYPGGIVYLQLKEYTLDLAPYSI